MNRRAMVSGFLGFTVPTGLSAREIVLGPTTAMGTPTRTYVQNPVRIQQKCDQWCWAASISMIFANLGHDVPQTDIVSKVFGSLVCAPAGNGLTMAMALSDSWIDTSGVTFQSNVVAAYDQAAGVNAISNTFILDELSNDRTLLYANKHHAMVVTAVDYFATPYGPNVQAVGVLDPWPYSPAFHPLTPAEIVPAYLGGDMTFLAAVHI